MLAMAVTDTLPATIIDGVPFSTAEEAWFWFCRAQVRRICCARPSPAGIDRTGGPDDVYNAVMDTYRDGRIHDNHLRTLAIYGIAQRTPDKRYPEEVDAVRWWSEAIDRIVWRLREKGIVA